MYKEVFLQIPADIKQTLATEAGIVLDEFDPFASSFAAADVQKNIIFATSGGLKVSCTQEILDHGSDVDNIKYKFKGFADVGSTTCTISGTAVAISPEKFDYLLSASTKEVSETDETVSIVKPSVKLTEESFKELWYVIPYNDDKGFIAVKFSNALCTSGFDWTSSKGGKVTSAFTYEAYADESNPEEVPMTIYIKRDKDTEVIDPTPDGSEGA